MNVNIVIVQKHKCRFPLPPVKKNGPTSPSSGLPAAEPRHVSFLNILKRANQTFDLTLKLIWNLIKAGVTVPQHERSSCWMSTGSATIKHTGILGGGGVQR